MSVLFNNIFIFRSPFNIICSLNKIILLCLSLPFYLFPQNFPDVGLVYSRSSAEFSGEHRSYDNLIDNWELYLIRNSIPFTIIDDDELDDFDFQSIKVLICPELISLSDDATENIKKFLSAGKGVFISGMAGSLNENGKRITEDLVSGLLGDMPARLNTDNSGSIRIRFMQTGLLNRSLSENSGLSISTNSPVYYLPASEINQEAVIATDNSKALLRLDERRGGRIVWTGFQPDQFIGSTDDQLLFNSIMSDIFNWLAGKADCWIELFPGKTFSAGFLFNLKQQDNFSAYIQDSVIRYDKPVILFEKPDSVSLNSGGYLYWSDTDYFDLTVNEKADLFRNMILQNYADKPERLIAVTYYPAFLNSLDFFCSNGADYIFDLDRRIIKSCKSSEEIHSYLIAVKQEEFESYGTSSIAEKIKKESNIFAFDLTDLLRNGNSSGKDLISLINKLSEEKGLWLTGPVSLLKRYEAIKNLNTELVKQDKGTVIFSISSTQLSGINSLRVCFTLPAGAKNISCYDQTGTAFTLNYKNGYYTIILDNFSETNEVLLRISYDEDDS
ncbi:MAG: hypothetical protein Kow0098_22820 [Ignavibacteriaceae bacterium]